MQRSVRFSSTVLTLIAAGAYAAAATAAGSPPAAPGASPVFGQPAQAADALARQPAGGASASELNTQWKLETEQQKERAQKRKTRRGSDGGTESWISPAGTDDDALQKNKPAFL